MLYNATESFVAKDDYARFATFASESSSPPGLGPENLASERVNHRFRVDQITEETAEITVDITFAEGTPDREAIHYLFLQRPRFTRKTEVAQKSVFAATDTIQAIFYADEIGGEVEHDTGAVASGMVEGIGTSGFWLPGGVECEALRLIFNATSRIESPFNVFDMGVVRFGPAFQFKTDYIGLTESINSNSAGQRPDSGASRYGKKGAMWRVWDLLFRCIEEEEREQVRTFLLDNFDGSQFLFGFDKARPQDAWMLGALVNPDLTHATRNFNRLPAQIEENI